MQHVTSTSNFSTLARNLDDYADELARPLDDLMHDITCSETSDCCSLSDDMSDDGSVLPPNELFNMSFDDFDEASVGGCDEWSSDDMTHSTPSPLPRRVSLLEQFELSRLPAQLSTSQTSRNSRRSSGMKQMTSFARSFEDFQKVRLTPSSSKASLMSNSRSRLSGMANLTPQRFSNEEKQNAEFDFRSPDFAADGLHSSGNPMGEFTISVPNNFGQGRNLFGLSR
jgi:hypothetical protein